MSINTFRSMTIQGLLLLFFLGFIGCTDGPPPPPPSEPPQPSVPPKLIINKQSVVIHDVAALAAPFSFEKTINSIVATAGGSATDSIAMLQSMIDSFAENSFTHPLSGKVVEVKARPLESALDPKNLLNPDSADGMIPVGLFNRFDLAPADGSNCGEYRIVYAKKSANVTDRMTIIFEARVPNPSPGEGLKGCAPITDFWAERSKDANPAQSVAALEKLYYQGIPQVDPIVKADNYGLQTNNSEKRGQIRVNLFMTPNPGDIQWVLREFIVDFDSTKHAILKPESIDDSPIASLFRAASASSDFSEDERKNFRQSFLEQSLCNLVNPDRINKAASATDIINGISAGFDINFNDFESISQSNEDNPASGTDPLLLAQVQERLTSLSDLSGVSPEQLMNRAGTMTCGGCHQFSAGSDLGNNAVWPRSLDFVHIDEEGKLSPLLTDVFIPQRIKIAQQFRDSRTAFHQVKVPCSVEATASEDVAAANAKQSRAPEDKAPSTYVPIRTH